MAGKFVERILENRLTKHLRGATGSVTVSADNSHNKGAVRVIVGELATSIVDDFPKSYAEQVNLKFEGPGPNGKTETLEFFLKRLNGPTAQLNVPPLWEVTCKHDSMQSGARQRTEKFTRLEYGAWELVSDRILLREQDKDHARKDPAAFWQTARASFGRG